MKSLLQRIEELEVRLAQTQREIARKPSREATPHAKRNGWFLGITRGELAPGGNVDVTVWIWSGGQWRQTNPIVIIEDAQDWFMNQADDPAAAGTKVRVDWYETVWVITAIYCDESDHEDSTRTPGGSLAIPPDPIQTPGPIPDDPSSIGGAEGYGHAFNSPGNSGDSTSHSGYSGGVPWQE